MAGVEGNDRELVFAGKNGFGLLDKETGAYKTIAGVWSDEEVSAGMIKRCGPADPL